MAMFFFLLWLYGTAFTLGLHYGRAYDEVLGKRKRISIALNLVLFFGTFATWPLTVWKHKDPK